MNQVSYVDGLGRAIKSATEDTAGASYSIVEQQYDPVSRAYKTSNPHDSMAQYWTETDFDALARPTKVTAPAPDSSPATFSYANAAATLQDPAGKQRQVQSDGLGRLATVLEPDVTNNNALTVKTSYSYSALNALTGVTQGSQTRTYNYDHLGRVTSVATPETGNVAYQYQYSDFDFLTQRTDPRGVITTYTPDTLNRLHQISYNVGSTGVPATATVTYNYGTTPSRNNNGRLITMTDGAGSETYTYDILGRMTQLQKVISGSTYTSSYGYDLASELTSLTYPSTRVVQQSYDQIGRLCAIAGQTSGCSSMTNPYASGFGYNTAFQPTGFQYGNGLYASFGFSADRLQLNCLDYSSTNRNGTCAHDGTTKFGLAYSYGPAGSNDGLIASITDNVDSGRSATYGYDGLYRLSSAVTNGSSNYPIWGLSWIYDRYGNRTAQNVTAGSAPAPLTPTDPATNHLTASGDTYDHNGNLTLEPFVPSNNNYTYDGENRLVSFASGGTSGTYTYDGNGLRVKKVSGSTTTAYIFAGGKVTAEYANGTLSKEYIYSGSQLLATIAGSTTTYHHLDHLSVRMSTNASGSKVGEQGHFPFGESWYLKNTTTKWQFTSYERDAESGNDYAIFRYDSNRLGRFLSLDPLAGSAAIPQSLNLYAYAMNDPINHVDPTGRDCNIYDPDYGDESCGGYDPNGFCPPSQAMCGDPGGFGPGNDPTGPNYDPFKTPEGWLLQQSWAQPNFEGWDTVSPWEGEDIPSAWQPTEGCSQGDSGAFGSPGSNSVFGANAFGQGDQGKPSQKGSNSCRVKPTADCSVYQKTGRPDLYAICRTFPTDKMSNYMRGCLQGNYSNGTYQEPWYGPVVTNLFLGPVAPLAPVLGPLYGPFTHGSCAVQTGLYSLGGQ